MSSPPTAIGDYPGVHVEYFDSSHRYKVNGEYVPSVTTVLGVLNKEALPNWAAKITRNGCYELVRKDRATRKLRRKWGDRYTEIIQAIGADPEAIVSPPLSQREACQRFGIDPREYHTARRACNFMLPMNQADFDDALKAFRLTHWQTTTEAAERGTDVHQVWEDWNTKRKIPDVRDYPKNRHPYIRAMSKFILAHDPKCVESEQVVGSAVHKYAGRLDTVVVLEMQHGLSMVDVKTSKAVYPNSHFPQLAGYEIARRECGLPPSEHQGILRLGDDGKFELVWSDAEPDDFLNVLHTWQSQQKWHHHR